MVLVLERTLPCRPWKLGKTRYNFGIGLLSSKEIDPFDRETR